MAMDFIQPTFAHPDLDEAIDKHPAIADLDTPLIQAIALMGSRRISCELDNLDNSDAKNDSESAQAFSSASRSGCVLVLDSDRPIGIVTERDIVKLTAQERTFDDLAVAEIMTQPVITLQEENFQDVFAVLFLFRRYQIRHLPIVDKQDRLVGVVSPETIRQAMKPANLLKLRRVGEVMTQKIVHASLDTNILNIARLMAKERLSCVVITQADSEEDILIPVGIITERDILQFKFLQLNLNDLETSQVMSTPLFLLNPEDSLLVAHQEMQRRRVRRMVVSWNWGKGLGIITQTSILRIFDPMEMYGVIETLQSTVQQLEREKAELSMLVKKYKLDKTKK